MKSADRRKHPRAALQVQVDIHSGSNFYSGQTRDLSEGGLFIEGPAFVPIGETITIRVTLLGKKLDLSSEVAWILHDAAGEAIGFGARFVHLTKTAQKTILTFMKQREPMPFDLLDEPAAPASLQPIPPPPRRPVIPPPLPWTPSCPPPQE